MPNPAPHGHQSPIHHQQVNSSYPQTQSRPANPTPSHTHSHSTYHPVHHSHHQTTTALPTLSKPKKVKLTKKSLSIMAAIIIAATTAFGAGYLLKGSNDSDGIPASITRQVNYDLYFPAPMPAGYTYMKDTATFQIGQVFYKFANGKKRVTVNEQPLPDPKPDLNKLEGYTQFKSPVGLAAIGTDLGEPTAVVVTPTTVITMHCIGGVSQEDLKTAITNLKNIGQKQSK
jgi:hypothetical protein